MKTYGVAIQLNSPMPIRDYLSLVLKSPTECQVEPAVSSDFSSKTTSFIPPFAR